MLKDKGYFEDLDDLLQQEIVEPQKNDLKKPSNTAVKKSFQSANDDDDIKFFGIQDANDVFKIDQNSPIKKETQKFERKKDVRSATMANNNNSTKANFDDFDDLFGFDFDSKNTQKISSNRNINKKSDENSQSNQLGKFQTQTNFRGDNEFEDYQQKTYAKTGMEGISKNDDLDMDLNGFSRRNQRRAGTYKDNSDDFNRNFQNNFNTKPPKTADPSLSMPPLNPSSLARRHPFDSQPFGRKREDDHLMASLDEADEGGNNRFGYGNRNNLPQTAKSSNQYSQGGGFLDPSPSSQFRARTQGEFGETSRSLGGFSKKGTLNQQEIEDNIDQITNDRNIESVSRVAASRRPRSSVQSQQSSANNTQNNILASRTVGGQSHQFDQQQQQYPRLMKFSEEHNINTNINLGFLNESATNRPTRSQQGGKNESSYISDKDLFGDSGAVGDDQIENKFSRRGSFPRGGDGLSSKNNQQPLNMQGQVSGFYQQPTQNIIQTGILSDIPDLKSSEMNFPGSKYDRSLQQAQEEALNLAKQLQRQEEEHKAFRNNLIAENEINNKKFRKNYDEQVISLKRNYEELLKFEKDRNDQLNEDMKQAIIKDRKSQRLLFDIEMQTMKVHFEKEKQQITNTHELKSQELATQHQKQQEIISLQEKLKQDQDKLVLISNMIDNRTEKNQEYIQQMNEQVEEKKRYLDTLESRLKMESEFIGEEKRRLEKIKDELVEREQNGEQFLKNEKELIRTEFQRLNSLQEQQRELDANRKNSLLIEITRRDEENLKRTEENLKIKEELERNWRELEIKAALFEQTQMEFQTNQKKVESRQYLQQKEIEDRQIALLQCEQVLISREKMLQLKEREINLNSVNSIQAQKELHEKRFLLEKEKKELEFRQKNQDQSEDQVREFKNTFELENLKIEQKNYILQQHERDLMKQAQSLKEERNQIALISDTLQGLKNEFVKNIASPQRIPVQLTFTSPTKNIPFGSGQQSQSIAALTSPQNFQSQRKHITDQKLFNQQQSSAKPFYSRTSLKKAPTEAYNENVQFFRDQKQFSQTQSRFDLNKIVREVNQIDQKQQNNIQYIMAEKERLTGSKVSARFGGATSIQQELINDETSSHYISEMGSNRHSHSNSQFNE